MAYEKQNFEDGKVLTAQQLINIENGLQAAESLIVTLDANNAVASHTPAKIYEHIQTGGSAFLFVNDQYCAVSHCNETYAYFIEFCDDFVHYNHLIDVEGGYSVIEMVHASQESIGDISTALDEIIAIQESLIGGESA